MASATGKAVEPMPRHRRPRLVALRDRVERAHHQGYRQSVDDAPDWACEPDALSLMTGSRTAACVKIEAGPTAPWLASQAPSSR